MSHDTNPNLIADINLYYVLLITSLIKRGVTRYLYLAILRMIVYVIYKTPLSCLIFEHDKTTYLIMLVDDPRLKSTVEDRGCYSSQDPPDHKYGKVVKMLQTKSYFKAYPFILSYYQMLNVHGIK